MASNYNYSQLCPSDTDQSSSPDVSVSQLNISRNSPSLNLDSALAFVKSNYGIHSLALIAESSGLHNRNFVIYFNQKEPIPPRAHQHGYALKIFNAEDSKDTAFFDAQTHLMIFLRQRGYNNACPLMNNVGKFYTMVRLGTSIHLVRLALYVPGKMLSSSPKTPELFQNVGSYIGQMYKELKYFQHFGYENHKPKRMLDSVPEILGLLDVVKEGDRKKLVTNVVKHFSDQVLSSLSDFEKSIIHGNLTHEKIFVLENDNKVSGIIDFRASGRSLVLFELATVIAHMILTSGDNQAGAHVIAGYQEFREIPENERNVLKVCVAARMCQKLVLQKHYLSTCDSKTTYVMHGLDEWKIAAEFWKISESKLHKQWFPPKPMSGCERLKSL